MLFLSRDWLHRLLVTVPPLEIDFTINLDSEKTSIDSCRIYFADGKVTGKKF